MKKNHIILLTFLLLLMASCKWFAGSKKGGDYVARVHDKYLLKEELLGLVPEGTSAKDSLSITRTYIDTWIRQMLVLHQAESNLDYNSGDFNREIEKYRNSLIIFRYESELVDQKMDTTITEEEIKTYYDRNIQSFILHENIVQADYIQAGRDRNDLNLLKSMLRSNKSADIEKLADYCRKNGIQHFLNDSTWLTFSELNAKIPLHQSDYDNFISGNRWFEITDSADNYLVKIREVRIKEGNSPLSYEKNKIKAAILNKRKAEMLHKLENDLYSEAAKNGKFEIY